MKAGSAQIDITPEPGGAVSGQRTRRTAAGVHDPLYASALALEAGAEALLLIACDLILVDDPLVADIRGRVSAATGVAPGRVWVFATHTHTGPSILGVLGTNTDVAYRERFPDLAARAAIAAWQSREEAVLGMAAAPAPGWTFPRRYWMLDGRVRMHPPKGSPEIVRPEGVADDELAVLWVRACAGARPGRLIGALVNFGCHPIVVGSESVLSADYPGTLRAAVQEIHGTDAAVLFGSGACGDTSPFEVERPDKSERGFAWTEVMGRALAARALDLIATGGEGREPRLQGDHHTMELPTRAPAAEAVAEARTAFGEQSLDTEPEDRAMVGPRETLLWARERQPTAALELSAVRIGCGALVTVPGELFASLGRRIKEASPFHPTLIVELANGYCGYLPTVGAFVGGGYETELARSSKLVPEAGPAVAAAAIDLLDRLAGPVA